MKYKYKLGFLGSGNMANAILSGILANNLLDKNEIIMSATTAREIQGIHVVTDNNFVMENCQYVIVAIKPQVFASIAQTLTKINSACIVSIMAGVTCAKIKKLLNFDGEIVRIMPNTPSMVGCGMTVIADKECQANDKKFVYDIFASLGKVAYIAEEKFDAVTSISGSGPAYVYYFINSMIKGGVDGGLSQDESKLLTLQTFAGAIKMIEKSSDKIEELIQKVCSKGGTTIQAIDFFKESNLENTIETAIKKCRERSEEISK
ncbi:MAG: pyrroline-5-carboxylate reductase [Clostridia bacterium]